MIKSKISLILTIIFSSVLLVSIIILAILQTNTKPNLPNPDTIKIYNNELAASKTYEKGSTEYNEILKLYNQMFEKTYLSQISDDQVLTGKLSEDLYSPLWSDNNKLDGLYLEFSYNNTKNFTIYRNGNSRRVDVKSLVLKLEKTNKTEATHIYYTIETPTDKKEAEKLEPCYPLLAEANTSELYTYVKTLL